MRDSFAGPTEHSRVGPWFTASFDSGCAGCGGHIYEGYQARYVDGEVVCEDCGEAEA